MFTVIKPQLLSVFAALSLGASVFYTQATELSIDVYNPGASSMFPVSSSIIEGDKEVLLVDAQFQRNDAQQLVKKLKATGKELKTIYISHGDPDFYFGLDIIKAAFPQANIIATPNTVAKIEKSMQGKKDYWGPILKDNAPQKLVLPNVFTGNTLTLEGETIEIKNLEHNPERTYLWIPSIKTVTGGIVVFDQMHVWVADTKSQADRDKWSATLAEMQKLAPEKVIPGHFLTGSQLDQSSIQFTQTYLKKFNYAAANVSTSEQLIEKVMKDYPQLGAKSILDLGAKVVTGEMSWH
ncbi:MBL fold metallo-hydrolase [Shewanella sp. A14]